MSSTLDADFEPKFIIDTGRNGVGDMRQSCSNWCNVRGAGVGLIPTTDTASPMVDAYLWLKTPGESDGCTQVINSWGMVVVVLVGVRGGLFSLLLVVVPA